MSKYIAALYAEGRVVTGVNHGDAFSKLSENEQDGQIESGFLDPTTGRFFTEEYDFYLKQIYLIRHGEAEGQHYHACLTEWGRQQSACCAEFLSTQPLSGFQLFCSPLDRCIQTAEIISEITCLPFETSSNLRKQEDEENDRDFVRRIDESLMEIPPKCLLISHSDFILTFIREAVGAQFLEEYRSGVPNAGVMMIDARKLIRRF